MSAPTREKPEEIKWKDAQIVVGKCKHVIQKCAEHLYNFPGQPILSASSTLITDSECMELWSQHSEEWNPSIHDTGGDESVICSIAEIVFLTRVHLAVALNPVSHMDLKAVSQISPITVITNLQMICQQWPISKTDLSKLIADTRRECYTMLTIMNRADILKHMIGNAEEKKEGKETKGESKKEEIEGDETYESITIGRKRFDVSVLASNFLPYAARVFMNLDLAQGILKMYPIEEIKINTEHKEKFTAWVKEEIAIEQSEGFMSFLRVAYFNMISPLGSDQWQRRQRYHAHDRRVAEELYGTEMSGYDMATARKTIDGVDIVKVYKGEMGEMAKNALLYSLYHNRFHMHMRREWETEYAALNFNLHRRIVSIHSSRVLGRIRLPIVVQIGSSFYVHHKEHCCVGDAADMENALILWGQLVLSEFGGKLLFGEDTKPWFGLFKLSA